MMGPPLSALALATLAIGAKLDELKTEFDDVLSLKARIRFYEVIEVAKEFVRLRREKEERIIPLASISEIRQTLDD